MGYIVGPKIPKVDEKVEKPIQIEEVKIGVSKLHWLEKIKKKALK
jgi:hypothetical protein